MLQNVVRGLCLHTGGIILVAGTIGLLTGVKHFLSIAPALRHKQKVPRYQNNHSVDRFTIRRTQSELGYTYWVLQGFGKYRGFTLFDTWQEAISEVERRQLCRCGGQQHQHQSGSRSNLNFSLVLVLRRLL